MSKVKDRINKNSDILNPKFDTNVMLQIYNSKSLLFKFCSTTSIVRGYISNDHNY